MSSIRKPLSEMTVDEFVDIISRVVAEVVGRVLSDYLEDMLALSSSDYIKSIEEARREYEQGEYVRLEDIENEAIMLFSRKRL